MNSTELVKNNIMKSPDYDRTIEQLGKLEYTLAIEVGNIKERLIIALPLYWIGKDYFPIHLNSLYNKINEIITKIPGDAEENTFSKSLRRKHLSTCKSVAADIIDLKCYLGDYITSLAE